MNSDTITNPSRFDFAIGPKSKPKARQKHKRRSKLATTLIAGAAAGFIPLCTFAVVHYQAPENPAYWGLALCGLAYSAPTVATWAVSWARQKPKAWAFTILVEAMLSVGLPWMSYAALLILVTINVQSAAVAVARSKSCI